MNIVVGAALQSRFAPLSISLHILFCIVATATFIANYIRYKKLIDIFWLIVCDLPVILQFYGDKTTAAVVGVCEVILLVSIYAMYLKEQKSQKENGTDGGQGSDGLKDVEQAVKVERTKLAGSDGDNNVISQAFDSDIP